jgi:hypothetical protein
MQLVISFMLMLLQCKYRLLIGIVYTDILLCNVDKILLISVADFCDDCDLNAFHLCVFPDRPFIVSFNTIIIIIIIMH